MFTNLRRSSRWTTIPLAVAVAVAVAFALALAACSGSSSPGPSSAPSAPSAPASSVGTATQAMAAVAAKTPWFDGVKPKDPNAVGASAWWEAVPAGTATPPAAWQVMVTVGWGDCQAGCINRHVWTWQVSAAGALTFEAETGPAVPEDQVVALAGAATASGIGGRASAGPVCPVVRPGQQGCDPRSVQGAVLVIRDASGKEVARATTDGSGLFRVAVGVGNYTVEAQAVQGLMGTAPVVPVAVAAGRLATVAIDYDTGIR